MLRARRARRLLAIALAIGAPTSACLAVAHPAQSAQSASFACFALSCGMPEHGAYPHLVVGHIAAIARPDQAKTLFEGMRRRGRWSALPPDADIFSKNLQPVAIDAGSGVVMISLTSQDEMHAAPLRVGDFVRYSPHRGRYEMPPTDKTAAAYWSVDGCVAILCRASDKLCIKRYTSGLFRATDGVQLSSRTLAPLQHGIVIDAQTMLPRNASPVN